LTSGCLRAFALRVSLGFGKLRQLGVGGFFFGERRFKQRNRVGQSELVGPGDQRAVAGDLVVLDGLCRGDEASVQSGRALELLNDFLALCEDSLDCFAGFAASWLADQFENLFEAIDLALGFVAMFKKPALPSSDWAARAILGSAFRICFSAK
jgi:hypothetical protein